MHPSLAWRSTILQLAWIAAVTTLALVIKLESLQYMLVGGIVAWGGALGAKARASAGGGGDIGQGGISIIPGPMAQSLPPGPMMRRDEIVSPFAKTMSKLYEIVKTAPRMAVFAWVSAASMLFFIHGCNQPAATVVQEIDAGVAIGKDVCEVAGVFEPVIEIVCPFLDKNGNPIQDDAGVRKTIRIRMPRTTWEALPARIDGGK